MNCYLVAARDSFVLIDNGTPEKRARLEAELAAACSSPGDLKLIVVTHGDYDHSGNATYLRDRYGTEVALHREDAGRHHRERRQA